MLKKKVKVISERQWRNLNKKLANIEGHLRFLEENLPRKAKRWLKFEECIPPGSVCKEVYSMLMGINTYSGFIGKLSEYYGCSTMELVVDTTIDPKYRAVYRADLKKSYTRTQTVNETTVLHEFFHHLIAERVVICDKSQEEKYADKYAEIFMQRVRG